MAKKQKAIVHKKGKDFPQEITELIEKAADSFMSAAEFCEAAKKKCIEYGIDTREVGKRLIEILLKKGKSLRTIQRYLPAEFKAKPRGAAVANARKADSGFESESKSDSKSQTENKEISDKNGANEPAAKQKEPKDLYAEHKKQQEAARNRHNGTEIRVGGIPKAETEIPQATVASSTEEAKAETKEKEETLARYRKGTEEVSAINRLAVSHSSKKAAKLC